MSETTDPRELSDVELLEAYREAKQDGTTLELDELQLEIAQRWEELIADEGSERGTIMFPEGSEPAFENLVVDTLEESRFIETKRTDERTVLIL